MSDDPGLEMPLQISDVTFDALVEGAADAIFFADKSGAICYFNKQAESSFGFQRAEVIGEPIEVLLPERIREAHVGKRARYLENPKRLQLMSKRLDIFARRKDGTEFPVTVSLNPICLPQGEVVVAVVRDLSEQERLTVLLKREQAAHAAAEAAARFRDDMVAIVAHDLKNPLITILMSVNLLLKKHADDSAQNAKLDIVKRSAERMTALVSDLLDAHMIEAGHLSLAGRRGYEAGQLLKQAVESQRVLIAERSIHIRFEAPPSLMADVHPKRIMQVFQNLIGNAIKFTPANGDIVLGAEKVGKDVRFSVADTGPGIEEKLLPRIFQRFCQAERTAHRGTGLGLSIAKGIVEAHGGKIWLESRVGTGTTFHFTVPIAREELDIGERVHQRKATDKDAGAGTPR
jgi:PAS domain S-box-containing protein